MASIQREIYGDFDFLLHDIHDAVTGGSISATYEGGTDITREGVRISVRMFERYSLLSSNRVSMTVTLVGKKGMGKHTLYAVCSGASQGVFFKLNTSGELAFLDKMRAFCESRQQKIKE